MPDDVKKQCDSINELATIVDALRGEGKTVVHCHGVFDLLHIGHIRYLQKAKRLGDVLIVTVTPDRYVNKGPHRPAFHETLRADSVAALECVDHVALNEWPTAVEPIEAVRPAIYVKGSEFRDQKTPELLREEKAVAAIGGTVEFIDEFTSSSSRLINTYLTPFPPEVESYLTRFRERFSGEDVLTPFEAARKLKVLVVGETIIDEYAYCSVIGRSMKSPTVAAKFHNREQYAGGAVAVANHVAGFCDQVSLFSMLGETASQQQWVHDALRENVSATFHHKRDAPTIVKRRYRETYYENTLFAVHDFDDRSMDSEEQSDVAGQLASMCGEYDLVIVADYGYGFLGEPAIRELCERARFLAISTSADSANIGRHAVSRYAKADYVCLSQLDLELECRRNVGDANAMLREVCDRLAARMTTVTIGKAGCLCYRRDGEMQEGAGLSTNVVDRIGAGEAFFAVTALCAAVEMSPELLCFCGNVAGAESVASVGNSQPLDEKTFERHVHSLLK